MIKIIEEKDDAEKHLHQITLSFDKEEFNKAKEAVDHKLAENIEIKGFRKGKAPIEEARKFINPTEELNQTMNKLATEGWHWIVKDYRDHPEKEPNFFIDRDPKTYPEGFKEDNLQIRYSFDLIPTATVNLDAMKLTVKPSEVTDQDVQQRINQDIESNATLEPKAEGSAVENGDTAVFDFEGKLVGDDGKVEEKPFEGGSAKSFDLEIGSHRFIPGFEEQIIGMKPGEEKDIRVTFPHEYDEKFRDKNAVFHINLHEIKQTHRPTYNDEFVKTLNIPNVGTDEKLRAHYKEELAKQNAESYKDEAMKEISEQLIKNSSLSYYPDFLVKEEVDRINQQTEQILKAYYNKTLDEYLELVHQTKEEHNKQIEENAKNNILLYFDINEVAKQEKLKVTAEEIDKKMDEEAIKNQLKAIEEKYNPDKKPEINEEIKTDVRMQLGVNLIKEKVDNFLFDMLTKKQQQESSATENNSESTSK